MVGHDFDSLRGRRQFPWLAYWMGKFVLEVRKKDGSEYPPKSLYALVCCFKRFLEQIDIHNVNPLNIGDSRFGNFRATLDAEMKHLHRMGLGASSKQAESINPDKESLLWTSILRELSCVSC